MQEANAQGIKPSALIRQLVYDYLAENTKEETYCEALVNDKQKWQDAVDARLEGRARNRRSKSTIRAERGRIIEASKRVKPWRQAVAATSRFSFQALKSQAVTLYR